MRVRERGRAMVFPEVGVGMTRRLAISTTSLPLNFFSSSRTSRCCTLWKALSSLYGTCSAHDDTRMDAAQGPLPLPAHIFRLHVSAACAPAAAAPCRRPEQPVRHLQGLICSCQFMMHGAPFIRPQRHPFL